MADDPIAVAVNLKAPESSEPKPDEGGVTTALKLFRNTILDLRNLLVAFVLLAVICGSFGYLKEKSPAAFWIAIALAGLCGVVAVWETILLVQRRHRDKALKSWAVTPLPSFRDDYFRVGPYDSADKDRYHRTDGVNRDVIKWVRAAETPLLYLSGISGTGKSSLIHASLIPALELSESGAGETPFVVIRVREFGDPLAQIREAVLKPGKIWKNPPAAYAHDDFIPVLSAVCERLKNDNKRLLLLFDQFEVVLIRHEQGSEETKPLQELFATVRAGARKRFPNLTVLLSFRSDYDHLLKQLGLSGQIEDENSKKVSAFSRGAASNFLTDPASGLQLGSERAKAVLDEAEAVDGTRGLIRPIVLNMLGKLLQRLAGKDPGEVPRGALLSDDIRRAVDDPRVRDYSRPVLQNLIHNGIRVPRTVAETSAATGVAAHLVEGCYRVLLEWPLVRSLEHSDEVERSRWEIAHDFIARLLVPILEAPRHSLGERLRRIAAPGMLLCSLAVIAVSVITSQREKVIARLSRDYGIQTSSENGITHAVSVDRKKITARTLPMLADLLAELHQPIWLNLSGCESLQNVDGLKKLKSLQGLDLISCKALQNVDGLKELKGLQALNLSFCDSLQDMEGLKELTALQMLNLSFCEALQNVNALKELKALQVLDLKNCGALQNVDGLRELKALQALNLSFCESLQNVDALKELKALQTLDLNHCNSLQDVDGLKELKSLHSLDLDGCTALKNVDELKELKALQTLDLSFCRALQNVDALKELKALKTLDLRYCTALKSVDELKELKALRALDLSDCAALENVDGLKEFKALQALDLSSCQALKNVEALKELKALQRLTLEHCQALQNVDGLKELKALQTLDLVDCTALQNVDGLKELKALKTLNLKHCTALQSVDGLKELKALQALDLNNCTALQNVESVVTSLPHLEYLFLRGVPLQDPTKILAMKPKLKKLTFGSGSDDILDLFPH